MERDSGSNRQGLVRVTFYVVVGVAGDIGISAATNHWTATSLAIVAPIVVILVGVEVWKDRLLTFGSSDSTAATPTPYVRNSRPPSSKRENASSPTIRPPIGLRPSLQTQYPGSTHAKGKLTAGSWSFIAVICVLAIIAVVIIEGNHDQAVAQRAAIARFVSPDCTELSTTPVDISSATKGSRCTGTTKHDAEGNAIQLYSFSTLTKSDLDDARLKLTCYTDEPDASVTCRPIQVSYGDPGYYPFVGIELTVSSAVSSQNATLILYNKKRQVVVGVTVPVLVP
jgi:hypothetical protein